MIAQTEHKIEEAYNKLIENDFVDSTGALFLE